MSRRSAALDPEVAVPRLAAAVEQVRVGGALRLRGPVERRGPIARGWAWLMRIPERTEVELDDIGAFVVERCDGRPLRCLADDLAAHLRLTRREAETALADFIGALVRRGLAVLDAGAGTRR